MERCVQPGRVAVASADGRRVDQHFGQARQFDIYDIAPSGVRFVERRNIRRALGHHPAEFDRVCLMLYDCEAVVVSRVGPTAAEYLLLKGLRVLQAPYPVQAVLERLRQLRLLGEETPQ